MIFTEKCKITKTRGFLEEPGHPWVPSLGWMWIFVFNYTSKLCPTGSPPLATAPELLCGPSSQTELPEPQVCLSVIAVYCMGFISLIWRGGAVTVVLDVMPAIHSHQAFCSVCVSCKWPLVLACCVATRAYLSSPFFLLILSVPPRISPKFASHSIFYFYYLNPVHLISLLRATPQ